MRQGVGQILHLVLGLVALLTVQVAPAAAGEKLVGPVPARVDRVIDGDTIAVRAQVWLGQEVTVLVRIEGTDTPELRGGCPAEKAAAARAKALMVSEAGHQVMLHDIRHDKYAGRVLARVMNEKSDDLASVLIDAGLARPYEGGQRVDWCALLAQR
jgi:endonuclease YncB( thermonuclease family)